MLLSGYRALLTERGHGDTSVARSLWQEPSSFSPEPGEVLGHPWPWSCCCLLLYCCQEGDSKAIAECAWPVTGKWRAIANQHDIHQFLLAEQGVVIPIVLKQQSCQSCHPVGNLYLHRAWFAFFRQEEILLDFFTGYLEQTLPSFYLGQLLGYFSHWCLLFPSASHDWNAWHGPLRSQLEDYLLERSVRKRDIKQSTQGSSQ